MNDGKTLVFVEVRMRKNHQFGRADSSTTQQKQQKLILAAQHFLQLHAIKIGQPACRFDIGLMNRANLQIIEWLSNAFET